MKTEEKTVVDMSELTTMILQAMHQYEEVDDMTFKEIIADIINLSSKYGKMPLKKNGNWLSVCLPECAGWTFSNLSWMTRA